MKIEEEGTENKMQRSEANRDGGKTREGDKKNEGREREERSQVTNRDEKGKDLSKAVKRKRAREGSRGE